MALFDRRLLIIWALLVAATLISWGSSAEHNEGLNWVALLIIAIAFVKVRFVGLDFMELREAPRPLRAAFEIWLVVLAGVLMALHAFGGMLVS